MGRVRWPGHSLASMGPGHFRPGDTPIGVNHSAAGCTLQWGRGIFAPETLEHLLNEASEDALQWGRGIFAPETRPAGR